MCQVGINQEVANLASIVYLHINIIILCSQDLRVS